MMYGQVVSLGITTTGHYILPLTPALTVLHKSETGQCDSQQLTLYVEKVCNGSTASLIAKKLHRQFAHATADKLITTINNSNSSWKNNPTLKKKLVEVVENCDTCQKYRKPPGRPVVALPLATKFQETVAMDLKMYQGRILLHLIDHATRLSQSVCLKSKQPNGVVDAILNKWVSVSISLFSPQFDPSHTPLIHHSFSGFPKHYNT